MELFVFVAWQIHQKKISSSIIITPSFLNSDTLQLHKVLATLLPLYCSILTYRNQHSLYSLLLRFSYYLLDIRFRLLITQIKALPFGNQPYSKDNYRNYAAVIALCREQLPLGSHPKGKSQCTAGEPHLPSHIYKYREREMFFYKNMQAVDIVSLLIKQMKPS